MDPRAKAPTKEAQIDWLKNVYDWCSLVQWHKNHTPWLPGQTIDKLKLAYMLQARQKEEQENLDPSYKWMTTL